ncbi:MAG: TerB family tellurite resistance protein [Pseudomonadota bacterium]
MLLGIVAAVGIWYWRFKMVSEAAGELIDAADGVRAAARRFAYRRRSDKHPADCVEDARLAAAGVMAAIASMDGPLSRDEIKAIANEARAVFQADQDEADEIAAFGRWIAGQCKSPDDGARRLGKIVRRLAGDAVGRDLVAMTERVAQVDGAPLSEAQASALLTLRRQFEG